jgi:hypothetical protein
MSDKDEWIVVVPPLKPGKAEDAWQRWCKGNPAVARHLRPEDVRMDLIEAVKGLDAARYSIRKSVVTSAEVEWIVIVPQMRPEEARESWRRWCDANPEILVRLDDSVYEEDVIRDLDGKDAIRIRIPKNVATGAGEGSASRTGTGSTGAMCWRSVRRQAEEAWRAKDYRRVVELYAPIAKDLTLLESRRLAYARKQTS